MSNDRVEAFCGILKDKGVDEALLREAGDALRTQDAQVASASSGQNARAPQNGLKVNKRECKIEFIPEDSSTAVTIWDVDSAIPAVDGDFATALQTEIDNGRVFHEDGSLEVDNLLQVVKNHHEGVNESWFRDAAERIQKDPLDFQNKGEMILQQYLYAPFSYLFISMNPSGYLTDQLWNSPISVFLDEKYAEVSSKPDAASTFVPGGSTYDNVGGFLIGELEIKPKQENRSTLALHLGDVAKCILTTSCSAISMKKAGVNSSDIAIPFLVAAGHIMLLCVTKVTDTDQPSVASLFQFLRVMNNKKHRLETFAYLAILLARQHQSAARIDLDMAMKMYQQQIQSQSTRKQPEGDSTAVQEVAKFTKTAKNRRLGNASAGGRREGASISNEELAKQAVVVAASGEITGLWFPWPSEVKLDMEDIFKKPEVVNEQSESPFYFRGHFAKDERVSVFCKVWHEGDEETPPIESIEGEIGLLALANSRGIPTPKILSRHSSTRVIVQEKVFHVVILSYINGTTVLLGDIERYAFSLFKAVLLLHDYGMLHCDLKPANICWVPSEQQVYLLDFGHAQMEQGAVGYRTTKGFEAPEIIAGERHSQASDAYGVGATVLAEMDRLRIGGNHWLRELSLQLMISESSERIKLRDAVSKAEKYLSSASCLGCQEVKRPRLLVATT